jgi:threonine dehydratase
MTSAIEAAVAAATENVRALLAPTPLVRINLSDIDADVYVKLETLQPTGSFKVRGAIAATAVYRDEHAAIVTASAGNHGLGVAYAASRLGARPTIFVPRSAPSVKIDSLAKFAVDLRVEGDSYDDAERLALKYAEEHGRFVSAYSDPQVIAGQSTIVGEITDSLSGDFTVVVPVGGGGLASGVAYGATQSGRTVEVIGVETEQSTALSAAVAAGRVVDVEVGVTMADGLAGNLAPDAITPGIVGELGVTLTTVSEEQISAAVRRLAIDHGLVVEGSGAVGFAALLAGKVPTSRPIVLVLTGRNITAQRLAAILAA